MHTVKDEMTSSEAEDPIQGRSLKKMTGPASHTFTKPVKRIHDGPDVSFFLSSLAYRDIMTFMLQLNHAMIPRKVIVDGEEKVKSWPMGSTDVHYSSPVLKIRSLLSDLDFLVAEAPPDTGPRRFGNVSFRKWYNLVEAKVTDLLTLHMRQELHLALPELEQYLLGSFGSPQRLDYGTGHELSFLAFLGCLWKIGFFEDSTSGNEENEERAIVIGIFQDYLDLIRKVIKLYTLEPAGSHGVWGLDDNSFLPYLFGSAQYCTAITDRDDTPIEGSLPDAPEASSISKADVLSRQRQRNMYFSAVGFITDIKSGPFWEHSPMLFDISGVRDGWGKINKGMIKMYNAEVLGKFPVVQHFPFGSLFRYEKDPDAKAPPPSTHANSQPLRASVDSMAPSTVRPGTMPPVGAGTAAPWATQGPPKAPVGMVDGLTKAPWASRTPAPPLRGGFNTQPRPPPVISRPGASSDRFQSLRNAAARRDEDKKAG
jgi:serine/threonine-protein phosphatase 2A activator